MAYSLETIPCPQVKSMLTYSEPSKNDLSVPLASNITELEELGMSREVQCGVRITLKSKHTTFPQIFT
jgi:hypothetical protein